MRQYPPCTRKARFLVAGAEQDVCDGDNLEVTGLRTVGEEAPSSLEFRRDSNADK